MTKHANWTRRDFLKTAGAATLSALAAGAPKMIQAGETAPRKSTADTLVVLWMAGAWRTRKRSIPNATSPS